MSQKLLRVNRDTLHGAADPIIISKQAVTTSADKTTTSTSFVDIDASFNITLANRSGGSAILLCSLRCEPADGSSSLKNVTTCLEDGTSTYNHMTTRQQNDTEGYNFHMKVVDLDGTTWTPQFKSDNASYTAACKRFNCTMSACEVSGGMAITENSVSLGSGQTTTSTSYSAIDSTNYKITLQNTTGQAFVTLSQDLRNSNSSADSASIVLFVDTVEDDNDTSSRDVISEVQCTTLTWVGDLSGQVLIPYFRSGSGGTVTAYGTGGTGTYEGHLVAAEIEGTSSNVTTQRVVTSSNSTTTTAVYKDVTGMSLTTANRTNVWVLSILNFQIGNSDGSDSQTYVRMAGGSVRLLFADDAAYRYTVPAIEFVEDDGNTARKGEFLENSSGTATVYGASLYKTSITVLEINE